MKRRVVTASVLWAVLAASGASAHTVYVAGHAPPAELDCPADNRLRAARPRPVTPAPAVPAAASDTAEPEVVDEVPDEAEVGEALAGAASPAPVAAADGFPLLFQSPRRLRIALWGDSHAAAHIFTDALVQALGLGERRVLPSFIPPTMGNAGVRLPLRRACMGPGWSPDHAYRNRTPGATWSRALTRTGSYRSGAYLWLDFRSPQLADSFRTLDIRLSPGPSDPRVFEKPASGDEAGLGSALESAEEGVVDPAAAPASAESVASPDAGGAAAVADQASAPAAAATAPAAASAPGTVPAPADAVPPAELMPSPPALPRYSAPTVLRLVVNDDPAQVLELDPARDNLLRIVAEHPIATVKLELVEGSVGLDGFVPHYDVEPDYLFDTLGIPGATARGLQFMGAEWDAGDPWPPYDLLLVEFGTNEGNYRNFAAGDYAQELRRSLTTLRQLHPAAACVLIGPTDRGVHVPKPRIAMKTIKVKQCKGKGKKRKCNTVLKQVPKCKTRKCKARAQAAARVKVDLLRYARIHATISELQREVGRDFQCHAWSWQDAMGGPGGIYRWVRQTPPLAQRDLIHLTGSGYRLSAQLFAQKLLGKDAAATTPAAATPASPAPAGSAPAASGGAGTTAP